VGYIKALIVVVESLDGIVEGPKETSNLRQLSVRPWTWPDPGIFS